MIPTNFIRDDNYLNDLQILSTSKAEDVETRITELLRDHSDSLIADLVVHPEHRGNYLKIGSNLRESHLLKTFQSSLGYIQRIARCLENDDLEGLKKICDQMSHLIPDLKLSTILTKFSSLKLPRDIGEVRAISHPKIRALVIASLINRDAISLSRLGLSKQEMLQIGPHLTYVDCHNCFDDSFTTNEIDSFLNSCSQKIKTLKISTDKITSLPALELCEELDCNHCARLTRLPALPTCTMLLCTNCAELTELPALPACTELSCSDCAALRVLPALPACIRLYCSDCTGLIELPALPACRELSCDHCIGLMELPELRACTYLSCGLCTRLVELPALLACAELNCHYCTGLIELPALPACRRLYCDHCTGLTGLPALPGCTHLSCGHCTGLTALPALQRCLELSCKNTGLTELPALRVCTDLICSGCRDLTALPELLACRNLDCRDCQGLTALPELPACTNLNCSHCVRLTALPALPVCAELDCSGCATLRSLPALQPYTELTYLGCPALDINSVPPRFRLAAPGPLENRGSATLQVRVKELNEDPLKVLLDLEDTVLTRRSIPRIQFIEQDGRIAEAADEGGVSRIFISRLMKSLISHADEPKQLRFKETDSGLSMPVFDSKRDFNVQIKGFQILGTLFQLCYVSSFSYQSVTTGICFDRKLFDIITSFTFGELSQMDVNAKELSVDIKLKLMTLFADAPMQKNLVLLRIHPAYMTPEQFETLRSIVKSSLDEEEKGPRGLHETMPSPEEIEELKPWLQARLRELLLKQMSNVDDWFPAALIAKQMHGLIGTLEEWTNLSFAGASVLDSRIQGVMDKASLLSDDPANSCINWEMDGRHLDPEKVEKTKGYVKAWINEATPKDLERLSNFIAGSPSLSPSKILTFQLYDTPPNRFPSTHSCSFTIDLTVNYPGYDEFKAKLEEALKYANNPETSGLEVV